MTKVFTKEVKRPSQNDILPWEVLLPLLHHLLPQNVEVLSIEMVEEGLIVKSINNNNDNKS